MSLRELIEQASDSISTFKYPNITECKNKLNEILKAAELGDIEHDKIESIDIHNDHVWIETSWSARQCENSSSYKFPTSIIDSEDPIKAATIWGLQDKISEINKNLKTVQTQAESYQTSITELSTRLESIML